MSELNEKPLVTVIIPSFNHAQYINEAISSVLNQSYENFELIIVDDGSTDGTHKVLMDLPSNDKVSILLNQENRGQSAVVNQALKISKGEFICFLPSDDWFLKDKLLLQVNKFLESDKETGVVYGKGKRFFPDRNESVDIILPMYKGWVLEIFISEENFVYPATPMFRKECFRDYPFDESYKAEGEAIYIKIAIKYKFEYVDEFVAVMRDHSYNTGKALDLMYTDNLRYWNEIFSRVDIPSEFMRYKVLRIAKWHRIYALESASRNYNWRKVWAAGFKAIRLKPIYALDYKLLGSLLISLVPSRLASHLLVLYRKNKVS